MIESQGFNIKLNIIYQDKQCTLKLAVKSKESCSKQTRHFGIKYLAK